VQAGKPLHLQGQDKSYKGLILCPFPKESPIGMLPQGLVKELNKE